MAGNTLPTTINLALHLSGLLLAPLMLGLVNKVKAAFAGRTGAPLMQPYFDIWKLLHKGAVYSHTTTWVFRTTPVVYLATAVVALLLVPAARLQAPLAFAGDLVLLAGIMGLARFFLVVGALDTGSPFEGMGASREAAFGALTEPALYLSLGSLVVISGSLSLSQMLASIGWGQWGGVEAPVLALIVAVIFLLLLVENARMPVDDPNTHLELTMIHEVMVLDHSGPDLGYITYASSLKLWIFSAILVGVAIPWTSALAGVNVALFYVGMALAAAAVGVAESTMARLRMLHVPNLLIGALVLSAMGVALALVLR